jgi:hypothetical protein
MLVMIGRLHELVNVNRTPRCPGFGRRRFPIYEGDHAA